MARLFDDASTQYLEYAGAVINTTTTFEAFTMACWFYADDVTIDGCLMTLVDNTQTNEYHSLISRGTIAGDPVTAQTRTSSATASASSSTGMTSGTWAHACGVWRGIADRSAYINGGSRGNNTTSQTARAMNRTAIGRFSDSTPSNYHSGVIAEAAIWNVVLSDTEIAALAKGVSTRSMQPTAIVGYWPIWGLHSPEIDLTSSNRTMTVTGATQAAHAPIRRFTRNSSAYEAPTSSSHGGLLLLGVG